MKSPRYYALLSAMTENDQKYLDARQAGDLEECAVLDAKQATLQRQLDLENQNEGN